MEFTETEIQKANKHIKEMFKMFSNKSNEQLNNINVSLCTDHIAWPQVTVELWEVVAGMGL